MSVITWQRVEASVVALAVLAAFVAIGGWIWLIWPFALFLLFDLSALGYLANTRIGAFWYNLVHNWAGPVVVLLVWAFAYLLTYAIPSAVADALVVTGLAWLFHIAVDRALGYGLKHPDHFQHTHLGWIGKRGQGHPAD
jgi:hypothetical protein